MENNEIKEEVKAVKKVKADKDPWAEQVTIKLPRAAMGEENFIIASLNGRRFKIMRGVEVAVPKPIADIIQDSFDYQDRADELVEKLVSN